MVAPATTACIGTESRAAGLAGRRSLELATHGSILLASGIGVRWQHVLHQTLATHAMFPRQRCSAEDEPYEGETSYEIARCGHRPGRAGNDRRTGRASPSPAGHADEPTRCSPGRYAWAMRLARTYVVLWLRCPARGDHGVESPSPIRPARGPIGSMRSGVLISCRVVLPPDPVRRARHRRKSACHALD
jgi:hypothetical protein